MQLVLSSKVGLEPLHHLRTARLNFASLRVVILSTVRMAMYCDWVSYRSTPRALSIYLTFSPVSLVFISLRPRCLLQ